MWGRKKNKINQKYVNKEDKAVSVFLCDVVADEFNSGL